MKHVWIFIGCLVIKAHDDFGNLISYDNCVLPPSIRFGRWRPIEGQDLERCAMHMKWMRHSLTRYSPYLNLTFSDPKIDIAHVHRSSTNREQIHIVHRSRTTIISTPFHLQGKRSHLSGICPVKIGDVIE